MNVAMIGNLAHHSVDDELVLSVFFSRDEGQRLDHVGALFVGCVRAMLPKDDHRRVTRITIQNCELERERELRITLGVLAQFA